VKKLYKNLTGNEINIKLFGEGDIHIPTGNSEIEERVVNALQRMTYVKLFEEVVEEIPLPKRLEELTNATLRSMCEEQGIDCNDKDTKAILVAKLRGE
jgi:hypothetical protein